MINKLDQEVKGAVTLAYSMTTFFDVCCKNIDKKREQCSLCEISGL